ncbi:MAG: winged helix-turn-helix domain-containing protein [Planctomycetota bacterium]
MFEWRDTYTVMRMEADAKKPEYKQKAAEMAARIKKDLICDVTKDGQTADRDKEIGKPAGELWKVIAREKIIRVADIPQKLIKYDIDQSLGAYGWLANEKKVEIVYHEIGKCVKLTKDEEAKIPQVMP